MKIQLFFTWFNLPVRSFSIVHGWAPAGIANFLLEKEANWSRMGLG